jgi:hypothetical protein
MNPERVAEIFKPNTRKRISFIGYIKFTKAKLQRGDQGGDEEEQKPDEPWHDKQNCQVAFLLFKSELFSFDPIYHAPSPPT